MQSDASRSPDRLKLELWPVERLIPSVHNARSHSATQVAEIAGSIRAFGFSNPILISPEGDIIAGHGRLAAARQLALAEVPVIVLDGLNDLQKRQLLLADNRIALNATWDMQALQAQLRDMAALGADLAALGFTAQELARALSPAASTGLTNEDHVPDVAENAVTRLGDIWCAGEHRLSCGSCTDDKAVAALFDGATPHLMVTDPPYGVDYDPAWRHRAGVNHSAKTNKIRNDKQADWEPTWALFPGHIAYVWHGAASHPRFRTGFRLGADFGCETSHVSDVPGSDICNAANAATIRSPRRRGRAGRRHFEAERFGCLEVDPQLVPHLHRQLGRISPLRILSM